MKTNQIFLTVLKVVSFVFGIFFMIPVIAQTENSAGDWLTYNRTYNSERYSPLKQITTANVKQLHLLHTFDLGKDVSSMQTGPALITTKDGKQVIASANKNGLLFRKVEKGMEIACQITTGMIHINDRSVND